MATPNPNCQVTGKEPSIITNPHSTASSSSILQLPTLSPVLPNRGCDITNSSPKGVSNSILCVSNGQCSLTPNDKSSERNLVSSSESHNHHPWDSFDDEYTNKVFSEASNLLSVIRKKSQSPKDVPVNQSDFQLQTCIKHTPARSVSHISPVTLLPSVNTSHFSHKEAVPVNSPARTPQSEYQAYLAGSCCSHSSETALLSPNFGAPSTSSSLRSSRSVCESVLSVPNGYKVTPPMCDCGKQTKRKFVAKEGPNVGIPFYVCPNSSGSNKTTGCGFFKWADSTRVT